MSFSKTMKRSQTKTSNDAIIKKSKYISYSIFNDIVNKSIHDFLIVKFHFYFNHVIFTFYLKFRFPFILLFPILFPFVFPFFFLFLAFFSPLYYFIDPTNFPTKNDRIFGVFSSPTTTATLRTLRYTK